MTQSGLIEILENRIAPAILVDPFTVTYKDLDGDKVMVKISYPLFKSYTEVNQLLQFTDKDGESSTNYGTNSEAQSLSVINLVGQGAAVGMDISVEVLSQIWAGDGKVAVGRIYASGYNEQDWDFPGGIDLGAIRIDGDLGLIQAGDGVSTTAIKSLTVQNLGIYGGNALSSNVLGPIGELHITGSLYGQLHLYGAEFASIGTLTIDGALNGAANLGNITFTGTIGKAKIGQIIGGSGDFSGAINSNGKGTINELEIQQGIAGGAGLGSGFVNAAKIKSLTIGSDVLGGEGKYSGAVLAGSIGSVSIAGTLKGDAGELSGSVSASTPKVLIEGSIIGGSGDNSGSVITPAGTITTSIVVGGNVQGGAGDSSGSLVGGNFQKAEIKGSLLGGKGNGSGVVYAKGADSKSNASIQSLSIGGNVEGGSGTFSGAIAVNGTLGELKIQGDLTGISSIPEVGNSGIQSGFVHAVRIGTVSIGGSLIAGSNGALSIYDSGAIRSQTEINSIFVGGNMEGNESNPAIISAVGLVSQAKTARQNIAIGKVVIGGDMDHADILAGYRDGDSILGDAINPDAQITSVTIHGNLVASNIVAGAIAGEDELFGTTDDEVMDNSQAMDLAQIFSKISEVVVKGKVLNSDTQDVAFGIVAQHVAAMRICGVPVELLANAENDTVPGVPIGAYTGTTKTTDQNEFHILEVKSSPV